MTTDTRVTSESAMWEHATEIRAALMAQYPDVKPYPTADGPEHMSTLDIMVLAMFIPSNTLLAHGEPQKINHGFRISFNRLSKVWTVEAWVHGTGQVTITSSWPIPELILVALGVVGFAPASML